MQVIIFPTKREGLLGLFEDTNKIVYRRNYDIPRGKAINMYAISDEPILRNDVYIDILLGRVSRMKGNGIKSNPKSTFRKVVYTTDPAFPEEVMNYEIMTKFINEHNSREDLLEWEIFDQLKYIS